MLHSKASLSETIMDAISLHPPVVSSVAAFSVPAVVLRARTRDGVYNSSAHMMGDPMNEGKDLNSQP